MGSERGLCGGGALRGRFGLGSGEFVGGSVASSFLFLFLLLLLPDLGAVLGWKDFVLVGVFLHNRPGFRSRLASASGRLEGS